MRAVWPVAHSRDRTTKVCCPPVPGHEGQIYTLTGPDALTHAEMAEMIGAATGREVTYVDIPPEQMRAALDGFGMDPWQAEGLIEDYAHYRRGEAAEIADGVERATGNPPRAFDRFARDA